MDKPSTDPPCPVCDGAGRLRLRATRSAIAPGDTLSGDTLSGDGRWVGCPQCPAGAAYDADLSIAPPRLGHWHCTACHHEWDGIETNCQWCGEPGRIIAPSDWPSEAAFRAIIERILQTQQMTKPK